MASMLRRIQRNVAGAVKDVESAFQRATSDIQQSFQTIKDKVKNAKVKTRQVEVTFNSTVPEHCRDALVRFRNSGVIDFDDYVRLLQDSMPDEFERAKEINLVWDTMRRYQIIGDLVVFETLEEILGEDRIAVDFCGVDFTTWEWTIRMHTAEYTRAEIGAAIMELYRRLRRMGDNDLDSPFTDEVMCAMDIEYKVTRVKKSKPHNAPAAEYVPDDMDWLQATANNMIEIVPESSSDLSSL